MCRGTRSHGPPEAFREQRRRILWRLTETLTEHVGRFDERGVQVGPVQAPLRVVDGEAVGSAHVGHQSDPPRPVHRRSVDLWLPAPLGPVHVPVDGKWVYLERGSRHHLWSVRILVSVSSELSPFSRIQGQSSWTVQILPDQDLPVLPVQLGHLDTVGAGVGPVQVLPQPVHRHPLRVVQTELHHVLQSAAVHEGPTDGLQGRTDETRNRSKVKF